MFYRASRLADAMFCMPRVDPVLDAANAGFALWSSTAQHVLLLQRRIPIHSCRGCCKQQYITYYRIRRIMYNNLGSWPNLAIRQLNLSVVLEVASSEQDHKQARSTVDFNSIRIQSKHV